MPLYRVGKADKPVDLYEAYGKGLWHLRQIAVYQSFVKTERHLLKI